MPPYGGFDLKERHYSIETSHEGTSGDRYHWLYAKHGKAKPRSSKVFNAQTQSEEDNPRKPFQIETNQQLFCLYSERTETLYASADQCRAMLTGYLGLHVPDIGAINIKRFIIDEDKFIDQINEVKSISFVARQTLFGAQAISSLFTMGIDEAPYEPLGHGDAPDKMRVELQWKRGGSFNLLRGLFNARKKNMVDSMVCKGVDDSNFEQIFNASTFTQKVSIEVSKDEQGVYNADAVRRALREKVIGV